MINQQRIIRLLPSTIKNLYQSQLYIFETLSSTNDYLLKGEHLSSTPRKVCIAEFQFAGRGRNHHQWLSPPGTNLYFSQLFRMDSQIDLSGITLVVGIVLCQLLRQYTFLPIMLKWPNDIYLQGKKLAGILTEISTIQGQYQSLVIGIGVNIAWSNAHFIELPHATDLFSHGIQEFDREAFIAHLITRLELAWNRLVTQGWASYAEIWPHYDMIFNHPVMVKTLSHSYQGIAYGINCEGYLRVLINGKIQLFNAAEVSILTL